jgi:hypothetical protein
MIYRVSLSEKAAIPGFFLRWLLFLYESALLDNNPPESGQAHFSFVHLFDQCMKTVIPIRTRLIGKLL